MPLAAKAFLHEIIIQHGGEMFGVLDVDAARQHEDAAAETHHLDRRAVQPGQHRPGNHLVDLAQCRLAAARDRARGRWLPSSGFSSWALNSTAIPSSRCSRRTSATTLCWWRDVEADQRLVEQQQARAAEQRLGQQQALPLAAGHLADRALIASAARLHQIERPIHLAPCRRAEPRQAPAMPVDRTGHEVAAAEV